MQQIGPYQVLSELGRGGMGVVYLARHLELGREVALKVLPAGFDDPRAAQRFAAEAPAAARLRHAGVVPVYELGRHGDLLYFAMERVEGEALDERLKRQGPLEPSEAVRLVEAVARAVAYAHEQGILHRDLKPSNVLVDREGRPRLADFGLGKDLRATGHSLTHTGEMLGTPGTMAPEQAGGERHRIGPATDVYGLGAVLYALLTGRQPFEGSSTINVVRKLLTEPPPPPSQLNPGVDAALEAICLRCLAKEPEERYPSAEALADALATYRPAAPGSRRPLALAAAAAVLALVVLGVAWAARTPPPAQAPAHGEAALDVPPEPQTQPPAPAPTWVWRKVSPEGPRPPGRVDHTLTWDPVHQEVVLFGGWSEDAVLNDLWAWNGERWRRLHDNDAPGAPTPRIRHAAAYDAKRRVLVVQGGLATRTTPRQGERNQHGDRDQPVADLWEWDGRAWRSTYERAHMASGHAARQRHVMAYHGARELVVLFGGQTGVGKLLDDTQEWWAEQTGWQPLADAPRPAPRCEHGLAYDAAARRLVLFGGSGRDDTWTLDAGGSWRQLLTSFAPPGRHWARLAAAPEGVVAFGGRDLSGRVVAGTCLLEGDAWRPLELPLEPAPRAGHALAYDARREVVVLFGGVSDGTPSGGLPPIHDEVWELSLEQPR